ncbi:YcxB family protein [Streptomyces fradiae]|uniref:YcxB family protein n=1 Tax=Streptomyces fradiae TaxID=1906 RepID=UPI0035149D01
MSSPLTAEAVELIYTPTRADVVAALVARARKTRQARVMRWLCVYTTVMCLVLVVLKAGSGNVPGAVPWGLLAPVVAALPAAQRRSSARQALKRLAPLGEFRTVVSDEGVHAAARGLERRTAWSAHPRYAEGAELFVLLTADRSATGLVVLPKRGLADPADVDRLRTLLDRNITRL